MKTQIATYIKKSGAIAVPLSTLGGLFADLLRPLGNIAWALTLIASLVLIISFFKWFKGDKKVLEAQKKSGELDEAGYQGKVDKNKWFTVFSFSAIAVPILLIFSLITTDPSSCPCFSISVPLKEPIAVRKAEVITTLFSFLLILTCNTSIFSILTHNTQR